MPPCNAINPDWIVTFTSAQMAQIWEFQVAVEDAKPDVHFFKLPTWETVQVPVAALLATNLCSLLFCDTPPCPLMAWFILRTQSRQLKSMATHMQQHARRFLGPKLPQSCIQTAL